MYAVEIRATTTLYVPTDSKEAAANEAVALIRVHSPLLRWDFVRLSVRKVTLKNGPQA